MIYHTKAKPETKNDALNNLGTWEDTLLKEYIIEFVSYKRFKKKNSNAKKKTIIRKENIHVQTSK